MKYNEVTLYGVLPRNPRIITDDATGEKVKAIMALEVIRGDRYAGDNSSTYKQNTPIIMTTKPELVEEIAKAGVNDAIYVKGVVVTTEQKKKSICDECGSVNVKDGTLVYVAPIFLEVVKKHADRKEAVADLNHHREISNSVKVMGTICSPVIHPELTIKTPVVQYQLAVARSFRVDENKTDFPWVKSFGDRAIEDEKRLRTSSKVLVDGYLRQRSIARVAVCPCCGNEYVWHDTSMEITPYSTEYISNFLTGEEEQLLTMANANI